MSSDEKKPTVDPPPIKSSHEILSELFGTFDAEPPVIVKKEKTESPTKSKKSKKKHKHKDKKHKKKDKKKKSELDLAEILIKQEKEVSEKKIKIEGTDLSVSIKKEKAATNGIKTEVKHDEKKTRESRLEEGELSSDEDKKQKKRKHKCEHEKSKKKKKEEPVKQENEKELQQKINDLRNKIKGQSSREKRSRSRDRRGRSRSRDRGRGRSRSRDDFRKRDRSREHRSRDRDRDRSKDYDYKSRRKDNSFYKEEDTWRSRGHHDRRHRDRSPSYIDKKKLLEIARKNAIQMMKSGNLPGALTLGPQAQEKVIAAIRAGGKTIEELTDFCKTLSKKEELGELSDNPVENGSDSDTDKPFHHPFQIKDRPTSITMNIKNSVPLPIKSTQERSSELRLQFPVSSGQLHRKTENEWVPVPRKKTSSEPKEIEAPPVKETAPSVPPPTTPNTEKSDDPLVDIGSIVSQRLTALRKLQENPHDVQALSQMYHSSQEMQSWAQSKQQPGQFTGTTGVQVLSAAELSSGAQAWAKKDQLTTATPVSGGMGMHLLQKMGWKPGEGLGKEKTGALEPLLLEVKLDKKGLVATEEQKKKRKGVPLSVNAVQNKHPVSLLGEYASKKKLGAPQYNLCFECGPDHKKNFLFKVILNGVEYKPNVASPNKKEAKANAASVCLQHLGLLPCT